MPNPTATAPRFKPFSKVASRERRVWLGANVEYFEPATEGALCDRWGLNVQHLMECLPWEAMHIAARSL